MTIHAALPFLPWDEPLPKPPRATTPLGGPCPCPDLRYLMAAVLQLSDEVRALRAKVAQMERQHVEK